jgi:hypothetical protein
MSFFELNCLTTANHIMDQANRQYHLSVHQAKARQNFRAAKRYARELNRAAALDTALMAATVIGIAVVALVSKSLLGG